MKLLSSNHLLSKISAILLFLFLIITGSSCNKSELTQENIGVKEKVDPISAPPVGGGGGTGTANYCRDCGGSTNPNHGCVPDYYDPGDRSTLWICMFVINTCAPTQINNFASNNNLADSINSFNSYITRDSLLALTIKGQDYITYAYYIGWVMKNHSSINMSNIYNHISFANATNNIAQIILYGNNNQIVITSAYRESANSMIDYYLSLNVNPHFNQILNQIKNDLSSYEGLNRRQLLNLIN